MKFYLVLAAENYYPDTNNIKFATTDPDEAEEKASEFRSQRSGSYMKWGRVVIVESSDIEWSETHNLEREL